MRRGRAGSCGHRGSDFFTRTDFARGCMMTTPVTPAPWRCWIAPLRAGSAGLVLLTVFAAFQGASAAGAGVGAGMPTRAMRKASLPDACPPAASMTDLLRPEPVLLRATPQGGC